MSAVSHLTFVFFLISNVCLANISKDFSTKKYSLEHHHQQCRSVGEICRFNHQCCSSLTCSMLQGKSRCLPSLNDFEIKRQSEDLINPPYYNYYQQQQQQAKDHEIVSAHGKKQEWDHCQYHEDCGEGNCCYVHFRFRSLPKWFCRPNRKDVNEPCEPLSKYQSTKDLPLNNIKEEMKISNTIEQE